MLKWFLLRAEEDFVIRRHCAGRELLARKALGFDAQREERYDAAAKGKLQQFLTFFDTIRGNEIFGESKHTYATTRGKEDGGVVTRDGKLKMNS